jgi:hypothetical protein
VSTPVAPKFKPKFQVAGRGFVAFPAFFIDELMELGRYLPDDFWVYLLVVWRDINHHADNTCSRSMRQFHIRHTRASKWTAALMVSSLFFVEYGWKHAKAKQGVPTKIKYLDGDFERWKIFIECLDEQFKADKKNHYDDCGGGFRAELLLRIIQLRAERTGDRATKEERDYLTAMEHSGVLELVHNDKGGEKHFVAKRLKTERAGVLSAAEQIEGSYPTKSEPEYDDDGKRVRMYRQLERSVSKITIDFRKAKA